MSGNFSWLIVIERIGPIYRGIR